MKCLETRTVAEGVKRRRYELPDGTRVSTYELPLTVVKALGAKRLKDALATYLRGAEKRQLSADIKAAVKSRSGWKSTAIAAEIGISEARVRQIRKELGEAPYEQHARARSKLVVS